MHSRRLMIGLGLLSGIMVALLGTVTVLFILQYYRAADYPGAALVSDHSLYKVVPDLYIRRDTSYRTMDEFPLVYNWYSNGFSLGPERRAQSACMSMDHSTTWLMVEHQMTVTLCETPHGRMIFVMRSLSLRFHLGPSTWKRRRRAAWATLRPERDVHHDQIDGVRVPRQHGSDGGGSPGPCSGRSGMSTTTGLTGYE